jgi:hypothetical protein
MGSKIKIFLKTTSGIIQRQILRKNLSRYVKIKNLLHHSRRLWKLKAPRRRLRLKYKRVDFVSEIGVRVTILRFAMYLRVVNQSSMQKLMQDMRKRFEQTRNIVKKYGAMRLQVALTQSKRYSGDFQRLSTITFIRQTQIENMMFDSLEDLILKVINTVYSGGLYGDIDWDENEPIFLKYFEVVYTDR